MRTLKFRAWDGVQNKMIYLASFVSDDLAETKNWKVMQFTGLLDKNGKEIYEGDIVKGETLLPMRVIWHKYMWAIEYWPFEGKTIETIDDNLLSQLQEEDFKVIGNIYENPELLDNKNK